MKSNVEGGNLGDLPMGPPVYDNSGVARPKAKKTSVGGSIAVPIDMGGLLMGTLGIGILEPYDFTPAETTELQQIATSIAEKWMG